ncbi:hypothetical protein CK203_098259 [Vitis vinifera]|uniref:Uncharacterized protein n=1 Tax=Vitis vinifera TaxID=29760 RepID=A0A438DHK1_VITVI|nr:hypothetical protein CK203_098259 [Vitis vinifera]
MPFPSSSEPSQALPLVDQPMPHQEPPTGEAAEHHSTSFRRYHFLPTFQPLLSHRGQCSARLEGELRKEVLLLMLSYFAPIEFNLSSSTLSYPHTMHNRCLGIKIHSQKSGIKSEELVVKRSLKLDALNLNWLGVIDGPPLHGPFRKEYP